MHASVSFHLLHDSMRVDNMHHLSTHKRHHCLNLSHTEEVIVKSSVPLHNLETNKPLRNALPRSLKREMVKSRRGRDNKASEEGRW